MADNEVVLRAVGDAKLAPGEASKGDLTPAVEQKGDWVVHTYDSVRSPDGSQFVAIEVDLSLFVGKNRTRELAKFGAEYSDDGGRTWVLPFSGTCGDNEVGYQFGPTSSVGQRMPKSDTGSPVLVRPFVSAKAPIDVGLKVLWL